MFLRRLRARDTGELGSGKEAKTADQPKLKGSYQGERVVPRQGQWRAQVSFV